MSQVLHLGKYHLSKIAKIAADEVCVITLRDDANRASGDVTADQVFNTSTY
jgi:hypothetical protein